VTSRFYRWGPRDAWSMTWTELSHWIADAVRMIEEERKAIQNGK
jgi:hypothetical protein